MILCVFFACEDEGNYPNTPSISFISIISDTSTAENDQNPTDNIQITFSYRDGDGDLGGDTLLFIDGLIINNGIDSSVIYRGAEAGFAPISFHEVFNEGVSSTEGTIVFLDNITNSGFRSLDTVVFELYMQDRAGNESNMIRTDSIVLRGTY